MIQPDGTPSPEYACTRCQFDDRIGRYPGVKLVDSTGDGKTVFQGTQGGYSAVA